MSFKIQTPEQLSAHLIALREASRLTQSQLAAKLGIGQSRIAKIEKDPLSISVKQLLHLLSVLNAHIDVKPNTPEPDQPINAKTTAQIPRRTHRIVGDVQTGKIVAASNRNAVKSTKADW